MPIEWLCSIARFSGRGFSAEIFVWISLAPEFEGGCVVTFNGGLFGSFPRRGSLARLMAIGLGLGACGYAVPAAADGTVVIGRRLEARNYDPHQIVSSAVGEILPLTSDTLVGIEDDLKTLTPALAESWTVSPDGKTYTFKLREDVTFCSGKKMTAKDVEATFARWLDPATNSGNKGLIGPVQSVEATGPYTVVFHLSAPYADLLTQLSEPYASVINIDEVKALGSEYASKHLDGTGPYCWDYWRPREEMSLTSHAGYKWGPAFYKNREAPKISRLILRLIPEENSRVASLAAGDSDISFTIPPSAMKRFRADPAFGIAEPRAFGWIGFIGMKIHRPLVSDLVVRQALNMAVDRGAIVDALYYGEATPAYFIVDPNTAGYNKAVEVKFPKFDPDGAKKLLDNAGWKVGPDGIRAKGNTRLSLVAIGYDAWRDKLEAFQNFARDVGIEVKLEITDTPVAATRITTKSDFDMWGYYGSYVNMGEMLTKYFVAAEPISPYRFAPEKGAEVNATIKAGREAISEADKTKYYNQAQELIVDGWYWIPLIHEKLFVIYNKKKVKGVEAHGLGGNGLYKAIDLELVK
jgi:peptide/nickel transport system substrate-binding protein